MTRSSVVLPDPLRPISATTSPADRGDVDVLEEVGGAGGDAVEAPRRASSSTHATRRRRRARAGETSSSIPAVDRSGGDQPIASDRRTTWGALSSDAASAAGCSRADEAAAGDA